jgi:D-proline reductase (dithiol) PrdB
VMGCAKDIVEHVGVPRFLFSDFPLGNAAGRRAFQHAQRQFQRRGLRVRIVRPAARTTVQSPLRWSDDASWKLDYLDLARIGADELARLRHEFDRQKELARGNRVNAA